MALDLVQQLLKHLSCFPPARDKKLHAPGSWIQKVHGVYSSRCISEKVFPKTLSQLHFAGAMLLHSGDLDFLYNCLS